MPFNLSPSRGFDTSARARFTNKACRINSTCTAGRARAQWTRSQLPIKPLKKLLKTHGFFEAMSTPCISLPTLNWVTRSYRLSWIEPTLATQME